MATGSSGTREHAAIDAIQRKLARLQRAVATLALVLVVVVAVAAAQARSTPAVLSIERLDIVEPDGQLAIVLSNSQRVPPATMDGVVILADQEQERRGSPGIIFFDGKGDEVGGLVFGNSETEQGFGALRHFSLDAYKQDQTVVIRHQQDARGATAGISVTDRPWDMGIRDAMGALGLELGLTRAELQAAVMAIPEAERPDRLRELFGVQRLFLGSDRNDDAVLVLHDGRQRPRIRIVVPRDGEPSITILDEAGEAVARLP